MGHFYCAKDKTMMVLKEGYKNYPDYYICPDCGYKLPLIETLEVNRRIGMGEQEFSTLYSKVRAYNDKVYISKINF